MTIKKDSNTIENLSIEMAKAEALFFMLGQTLTTDGNLGDDLNYGIFNHLKHLHDDLSELHAELIARLNTAETGHPKPSEYIQQLQKKIADQDTLIKNYEQFDTDSKSDIPDDKRGTVEKLNLKDWDSSKTIENEAKRAVG